MHNKTRHDIKDILYDSYCYSIESGLLSISQKQGIITLIPKQEKDTHYLKNWRPISLLTVDYKILSSALATRLKSELITLIHEDQTGFVKGHYIGESIRKVIEIIEYMEVEDNPGVIMAIDFQKAYDSLEWSFIFKTLRYLNFGHYFIKLVNLLYTDSKSCCINNGYSTEFFPLGRGIRQGCPLSPYLFILCAEILGNAIRRESTVGGILIKVGGEEQVTKLGQYADDTHVFLDGKFSSITSLLKICHQFEQISGLKLYESKTKIACIGNLHSEQNKYKEFFPQLDWVSEKVRVLGVDIPLKSNRQKLMDWNLYSKLKEIKSTFNRWKKRNLTLYGKNVIIKSFGGAPLSFFLSILPTPDENFWTLETQRLKWKLYTKT